MTEKNEETDNGFANLQEACSRLAETFSQGVYGKSVEQRAAELDEAEAARLREERRAFYYDLIIASSIVVYLAVTGFMVYRSEMGDEVAQVILAILLFPLAVTAVYHARKRFF